MTLQRFDSIRIQAAAERIQGVLIRTPLLAVDLEQCRGDGTSSAAWAELEGLSKLAGRIDLRLKLECLQQTGSFKTRGAWNNISQLTDVERRNGVVAASSGNHGRGLAWAAARAGVPATIVMPKNSYPNKIEACRELGAKVVLTDSREESDDVCAAIAAEDGARLIHPYDNERTIEGAGTVGLEIHAEWPEVDVCVFPVGGGGLLAGSSLALRRAMGSAVKIVGVEPAGAPSMALGLEAGKPVRLPQIKTEVQGLCPIHSGSLNIAIASECVDRMATVEDNTVFDAQSWLANGGAARGSDDPRLKNLVVEPAGAATAAYLLSSGLPEAWLDAYERPLRVAIVISGGNPSPQQFEAIRSRVGA